MKRITSIQFENFRAFYGLNDLIALPNGENLLIYGENGSGKSSLFKGLEHFFKSSRNVGFLFEENSHADIPIQGSISINFVDINALGLPIAGTDQLLTFTNNISNHRVPFVQNADLVKGFLDYRNLLRVYFGNNNNVFDLIINDILYDTIPTGEIEGIGIQFKSINAVLKNTDRRYNEHKVALNDLPRFEAMLRIYLDRLFLKLNRLLIDYFKMNLRIWYQLQQLQFNHDYRIWDITQDLRLVIKLDGKPLINHTEYLNEARLSALAISLYLSSLKQNPVNFDYKILFLDDVFIGLDASNRIPILKIINNEFSDYQVFITTYDRHWYEMAQRFFNKNNSSKWTFNSLYVGREVKGNKSFDKPVLIQGDNDYNKALYYLHHSTYPDYPASANYFRKFAEDLLTNHLPAQEIRNDDFSLIETYKLASLVKSGMHFLNKIGAANTLLVQLQSALPTLLHPLSHFNLSSPIYKGELIDVENCLSKLEKYLIALKNDYKVFLPEGRMIKLAFTINATNTGNYDIYSKETIYLIRSNIGILCLSSGACHCKKCYTISNGAYIHGRNFNNNDAVANYISIENSYNIVYNHIIAMPGYGHIARAADYTNEFLMHDGTQWLSLNTLMTW